MTQSDITKPIMGTHISLNDKLELSIINAVTYDIKCIQLYLGGRSRYDRKMLTEVDFVRSKYLCKQCNVKLFVHSSLVYNLAGQKESLAWRDEKGTNMVKRCLAGLQLELDTVSEVCPISSGKTSGVVVHPGNHVDRRAGLLAIAESINKLDIKDTYLLLENSSGGGSKLATSFEEIGMIIRNVREDLRDKVAVCVDTAHIFGFGSYDLRRSDEVMRMFEEFDRDIGLDKFKLLHLNDSRNGVEKRNDACLGSCKDLHEKLGEGWIWGESTDSLVTLLRECAKRDIMIISETPDGYGDILFVDALMSS